MFKEKNVLVTGCGSLGRELIKQLLSCKAKVSCLDHSEQAFFKAELELGDKTSDVKFFLRDVTKYNDVHSAIEDFQTDYVIHTVAKKFVNYIEANPLLAINTNIFGTLNILKACIKSDVKKMINVSTDKVCNATSIYGLTKSIAERLVNWMNTTPNKVFSSIRHPNFMPSDGSCFTIWAKQAAKGDPITITDHRMRRWFIPIEDAAKLTIESLKLAEGGEIFVPATAKEYKIVDLARKYGKNLKVTGKRPGERLSETLMTKKEKKKAKLIGDLWRFHL